MPTEYGTGEFEEDGALDELDALIFWLTQRIEDTINADGFSGIELFGVRANIAMLATIIRAHGGGHLLAPARVSEWAQRIDQVFTTESMRGFTGWPEEAWTEWRTGCRQTLQNLLDILDILED